MLLRVFGALLLCLMCGVKGTKKLRILNAAVDRAAHYRVVSLTAAFTSRHETLYRLRTCGSSTRAMCDLWNFVSLLIL